ncbi:MAG: hypothetical protein LBJ64_09530 [Deltaproteobacteria bacterium]|jgi:hypothetical protein|nr:hypothetical protein [Deltaproteobacteria bacterium]
MADEKLNGNPVQPAKLPEGIYLETKKNIIGTGSTAKVAEYRNFWATLKVGDEVMEMVLLDDSFGLTGIREKFSVEVVSGSNWLFVEQGEKRYRLLRQKLDNLIAPPKKAAAPQGHAGGAKKPQSSPSKKNGWWTK